MKKAFAVVGTVLLLCACALSQAEAVPPAAVAFFQSGTPGAEPGSPPPNVLFRTQRLADGKITTSFAVADAEKPVAGAPYTATGSTETTQTLADGNRIVNKSSAFLARDSQGRTRREESMGALGPLAVNGPKMAFINDPVSKVNYILDLSNQTAHAVAAGNVAVTAAGGGKVITEDRYGLPGQNDTGKRSPAPAAAPVPFVSQRIMLSPEPDTGAETRIWIANPNDAGQSKTESLGTQVIEGVTAEGKRVTRTIPAGQIGNERPLEITSEVWTSPDLQVVVLSKRSDPRFGETVYRLTDIKRAEPDHSLFEVPASFSVDTGAH
jgi:hypothetical protein